MKSSLITYMFIIICSFFNGQLLAQDYIEEYEDESYNVTKFNESKAHRDYIKSDQKVVEFDEDQWQKIKRSVAEGMAEEYYELVDSGDYELSDADNPYKKSRRSFKRYWRKKNAHRAKRLPKERTKRQKIKTPDFDLPRSPLLSIILIVVVVIGVSVLIFFLFFHSPKNKGNKKISQDLEGVIPTEIPKTELELMLEKALQKNNYREAIRVYFIFIIRGLIIKDWIKWEKEKTNFSYLSEMRNKPLSKEFESTVSVYEIVWYGKRELTKEEYETLEPRFKKLAKELGQ